MLGHALVGGQHKGLDQGLAHPLLPGADVHGRALLVAEDIGLGAVQIQAAPGPAALLQGRGQPRHVPALMFQVADIPRTMNGKKVESAVTNMVNGRSVTNRDALENPGSLDIYEALLPELQK